MKLKKKRYHITETRTGWRVNSMFHIILTSNLIMDNMAIARIHISKYETYTSFYNIFILIYFFT